MEQREEFMQPGRNIITAIQSEGVKPNDFYRLQDDGGCEGNRSSIKASSQHSRQHDTAALLRPRASALKILDATEDVEDIEDVIAISRITALPKTVFEDITNNNDKVFVKAEDVSDEEKDEFGNNKIRIGY